MICGNFCGNLRGFCGNSKGDFCSILWKMWEKFWVVLWEILSEFKANIFVLGNNLNILGRFCEDFYSIFLGKLEKF